MEKRKKSSSKLLFTLLALILLIFPVNVILFVTSTYSIVPFLVITFIMVALLGLWVFVFVKQKKRKIQKTNISNKTIISSEEDMINLYNLAGIPIIRDENGKIKDIFELLQLEKQYDINGNRIRTIYELLGIVPRFDKNGKEIPTVLSIKNRVRGFVKPEKRTGILTQKLTDEQKEELLLKQMLQEKLKESEEKGDQKKANAIKKVINAKKKEEKKSAPKPTKIVTGKGKAVQTSSQKLSKMKIDPNMLSWIWGQPSKVKSSKSESGEKTSNRGSENNVSITSLSGWGNEQGLSQGGGNSNQNNLQRPRVEQVIRERNRPSYRGPEFEVPRPSANEPQHSEMSTGSFPEMKSFNVKSTIKSDMASQYSIRSTIGNNNEMESGR